MGTAAIAAAAAVLGALANGLLYLIPAIRADRRAAKAQQRDALGQLLPALTAYRQHAYAKIRATREGRPDSDQARDIRWKARTALNDAVDAVYLATGDPSLLAAVRDAVDATRALGDIPLDGGVPEEQVQTLGDRARHAHDALRTAAARHLHNH